MGQVFLCSLLCQSVEADSIARFRDFASAGGRNRFYHPNGTRSTREQGEVWERARKSVHPNGGRFSKSRVYTKLVKGGKWQVPIRPHVLLRVLRGRWAPRWEVAPAKSSLPLTRSQRIHELVDRLTLTATNTAWDWPVLIEAVVRLFPL